MEIQSTLDNSIITEKQINELNQIREERNSQSKSYGIALKKDTKIELDDLQYRIKKVIGEHYSHDYIVNKLLQYKHMILEVLE